MASLSIKRRIEQLEKMAAGSEHIGLDDVVRASYLPPGALDPEMRLQIAASPIGKLIAAVYGSGRAPKSQRTPPTATPAPATIELNGKPAPRAVEPMPPQEPEIIPAQPGLSLDQLMMQHRTRQPLVEPSPAREAFEQWDRETNRFPDDATVFRKRHPGL